MKYSVLMSVYKGDSPEFLKASLESVYEKQTKKPDEIVIVFDGPLTEELYTILKEFKKNKENIVKFVEQETNEGLGEALRIGSEYCTGDYIFRMDSDDISAPDRFDVQSRYAEEHPDIDVIGADIAEFAGSLDEKMRVRSCPEKHEDILKMAKRRNPMNHVSVLIKRSALLECGGYEEVPLLEDYYLWLKMFVAGKKLCNINKSVVYVRLGLDFNKKRASKKRVRGWWKIQKFMLKHRMITLCDAFGNMIFIVGFVSCPAYVRKVAYNKFLRGGVDNENITYCSDR